MPPTMRQSPHQSQSAGERVTQQQDTAQQGKDHFAGLGGFDEGQLRGFLRT